MHLYQFSFCNWFLLAQFLFMVVGAPRHFVNVTVRGVGRGCFVYVNWRPRPYM